MTTFLNFLIIVLTIIGIVQVVRIIEIATKLKGPQEKITTDQDNRYNALAMLIVGLGFTAFVAYSFKLWGHLVLPDPVSVHGEGIKMLWDTTMCEDNTRGAEVRELMNKAFKGALTQAQQQVLVVPSVSFVVMVVVVLAELRGPLPLPRC